MSELPQGWTDTSLGEVIELRYGKSLPEKDRVPGDFGVYGSNGVVGSHTAAITDAPAIVVGRKGSIGEVHFSETACFPIDTTYFVDRFDGIEPRFALHLLGHLPLREMNRASAIPGLNREDAYGLPIAVPPLPEQRRIVAKIDGLTGKSRRARDHLDHIPRLVEKYKQAVLAAAFRGDLTREWSEEGRLALNNHGMDGRLTNLSILPAGWSWTSMGAVAQITGGLTKNAARNALPLHVPYLRVANVYANELRLDEITEIGCTEAEYQRTLLQPGDLLIVEGNGSLDQIGRVALWDGEHPGCAHQNHLIRARMGDDLIPPYTLYWLLSPQGRNAIETVASSSSGLHTLSISKVRGLPVPICSKEQQEAIVRRIRSAFIWIDRLASEATSARRLIDRLDQSVLAKAFRGELVPQDPEEEPASVLLERIRAERGAAPKAKRGRKGMPSGAPSIVKTG